MSIDKVQLYSLKCVDFGKQKSNQFPLTKKGTP